MHSSSLILFFLGQKELESLSFQEESKFSFFLFQEESKSQVNLLKYKRHFYSCSLSFSQSLEVSSPQWQGPRHLPFGLPQYMVFYPKVPHSVI